MNIEIKELHNQCSHISCLTDDLTKLTRSLTSTALRASERSKESGTIYGLNSLLINILTRTLQTLTLIYGLVNELAGPDLGHVENAPDNLVALAPQFHSNS